MSLININFPNSRVREWNGRIIYAFNAIGATATIPASSTNEERAAVGIYERVYIQPPIDTATQKLGAITGPVLDAVAGTATYSREVVALTQEELDARVEQTADNAERDLLKQAYQIFKDGTATNAQAQRAIAWLIKQVGGSI